MAGTTFEDDHTPLAKDAQSMHIHTPQSFMKLESYGESSADGKIIYPR
jgi:hypothetical protein